MSPIKLRQILAGNRKCRSALSVSPDRMIMNMGDIDMIDPLGLLKVLKRAKQRVGCNLAQESFRIEFRHRQTFADPLIGANMINVIQIDECSRKIFIGRRSKNAKGEPHQQHRR
jgi:hypothetical protein